MQRRNCALVLVQGVDCAEACEVPDEDGAVLSARKEAVADPVDGEREDRRVVTLECEEAGAFEGAPDAYGGVGASGEEPFGEGVDQYAVYRVRMAHIRVFAWVHRPPVVEVHLPLLDGAVEAAGVEDSLGQVQ